MNTHWDHVSDKARKHSGPVIRKKINELGGNLPVIVTRSIFHNFIQLRICLNVVVWRF